MADIPSEDGLVLDIPAPPGHAATYTIHKLTYSDGRAYRYHVSDEAGNLLQVAERTGALLPSPTRLIEFFDPENNPSGRLQPPDVAPWLRGTRYEVFAGAETEEPCAVIQEQWRLVDILLLRMPRYEVQLGQYRYVARGSHYGAYFYEIFQPGEEDEEADAHEEGEEAPEPQTGEAVEGEEETQPPDEQAGEEEGIGADLGPATAGRGARREAEPPGLDTALRAYSTGAFPVKFVHMEDEGGEGEPQPQDEQAGEGEGEPQPQDEQAGEGEGEPQPQDEQAEEGEGETQPQDEQAEEGEEESRSKEIKVGQIQCPTAGASYIVECDVAPLCQSLLVLAALVILIDMEAYG